MFFRYVMFVVLLTQAQGKELILGNVLWRHGDRSSRHTYPNDPYKDVWKDGEMQLTERGMAQTYDLGLYLRSKYGHLLSNKYREGEIYVKSTDTDRSLMSAQCVMAGLYSPENATKWSGPQTYWKPFPVHSTELSTDWLKQIYQSPEKGCAEFDNLIKKVTVSSSWYKSAQKKFAKFLENVTKFAGVNKPYTVYGTDALNDNLFCLKSNGYTLPRWADDKVMATLAYFSGINQGLEFTDIEMKYTKKLSKMRSGIILEKMVQNMKKRINGEVNYSFVGYSAHDSTVAPLLISLGAFNWIKPPYASCVMVDLYKNGDASYSVSFSYRNESTSEPHQLSFYECGSECSFEKFEEVASTVITDVRTPELCGIKSEVYCCAYLLVGLAVFTFSTALFLLLHYCCKNRTRKILYNPLREEDTEFRKYETSFS